MWRAAGTNAEPLGWLSKITLERFHLDTLHPPGRPQGSPPRSTPPPPLLLSAACHDPLVVIVRAGVVWSGVGWRPLSHVQVFSHCAEQRCLPSSALAIRALCGFAERWGMVRRSPWGRENPFPVGRDQSGPYVINVRYLKMLSGRYADTIQLGASTISLIFKSTAAPHKQ